MYQPNPKRWSIYNLRLQPDGVILVDVHVHFYCSLLGTFQYSPDTHRRVMKRWRDAGLCKAAESSGRIGIPASTVVLIDATMENGGSAIIRVGCFTHAPHGPPGERSERIWGTQRGSARQRHRLQRTAVITCTKCCLDAGGNIWRC